MFCVYNLTVIDRKHDMMVEWFRKIVRKWRCDLP